MHLTAECMLKHCCEEADIVQRRFCPSKSAVGGLQFHLSTVASALGRSTLILCIDVAGKWERTVSYLSLDRPLCKDAKGVHPATKENFIVIVLANLTKALVGSLAHSSPVAVAITYAAMDTMKETSGVKRMASNACANGQKTH